MRIIAGKFGGRKLVAFKADHIRPTTDRVKEVIFNKIQAESEGSRFLDLFAGTGSLALEAVSRGAAHVHAVEKSAKSIHIIRDNRNLLKIPESDLTITKQDVFNFLRGEFTAGYDVILIDPPFTEEWGDRVMTALGESQLARFPAKIFIETGRHEVLKNAYGPIVLVEQKNYGDKYLTQFQCQP